MDETSYNTGAPAADSVMGETRRELRQRRRPLLSWGRTGAAVAVTAVLALGGYGFVSATSTDAPPTAALAAEEVPPRAGTPSRSIDRLPIDDAVERDIVVEVDGERIDVTTRARTLSEALADAGIVVGYDDEVSAPMNGDPVDVTIDRVEDTVETVEEKVPFKTTRTETSSLLKGQERVQTKGQDGVRTATKRVWRKGGEVISEEILAEAVGSEPVDEVILVGTATPPPAPKPAPSSASSSSSSSTSSSTPAAPAAPAPGGSPKAIAQGMLGSYGWGMDQWSCLERLWQRESGWNPRARNPYSGAYGIPQSLPASKMASAGGDYLTNPATQIRWGLGYIKGRYGSPCGAWGHSQRTGWY